MTHVMQTKLIGNDPVSQTAHRNTERYKMIKSTEIISFLKAHGFELTATSYASPKDVEKQGYQKHMMVFEHPNMFIDNANLLQLLVANSHDGKSSLKLDLGIFRTICANDLIVGDSFFSERIRHVGNTFYQDLNTALEKVLMEAPRVAEGVRKLQGIELTDVQIAELASRVLSKRLESFGETRVNMMQVIEPQRRGDWSNDAYTILNRLQERVIKGGIKYEVKKFVPLGDTYVTEFKKNTTREIKALDAKITLNKMVFDTVAEYCEVS